MFAQFLRTGNLPACLWMVRWSGSWAVPGSCSTSSYRIPTVTVRKSLANPTSTHTPDRRRSARSSTVSSRQRRDGPLAQTPGRRQLPGKVVAGRAFASPRDHRQRHAEGRGNQRSRPRAASASAPRRATAHLLCAEQLHRLGQICQVGCEHRVRGAGWREQQDCRRQQARRADAHAHASTRQHGREAAGSRMAAAAVVGAAGCCAYIRSRCHWDTACIPSSPSRGRSSRHGNRHTSRCSSHR